MRLLTSWLLVIMPLAAQHFELVGPAPGWDAVLRSIGLVPATKALPQVIAVTDTAKLTPASLRARVEDGLVLTIAGHSALAGAFGIQASAKSVAVRQIRDEIEPGLPVIWEEEAKLAASTFEAGWTVRARERWTSEPVLAIRKLGKGGVLWTATAIGDVGYERYPFLPQALFEAGLVPPARGRGLWAFFDAGYRQRVDLDYLVSQWKQSGIAAIHVTSWQFDGATPERAAWLAKLIAICHQNLIHVYAWVELPHVSEKFWNDHPQCRERTASGMEASLDWRRLMNLVNPDCSAKAERSVLSLLRSFDWDGVNLGELYFESLEGHQNPARMTPFNEDVRKEYTSRHGRDMIADLSAPGLRQVLDYRAELAARLQSEWLTKLETLRKDKPNLDIMLTHIDDRFDTSMRDSLGADAARLLTATEASKVTFLIEDPATVWHLGPKRYAEIRKRYEGLTGDPRRLAIDLNIVDRYQNVYPTKRQTGAELAQLVHEASTAFGQVALYFEYSLKPLDQPLLRPASSGLLAWEQLDGKTKVSLQNSAEVRWKGPALVNGVNWPFLKDEWLLLPAGPAVIEAGTSPASFQVLDLNVRLTKVDWKDGVYEISFVSPALGTIVLRGDVDVLDGVSAIAQSDGTIRVSLPRGEGRLRLAVKPISERQPAAPPEPSNSTQPRLQR